MKHRDSDPERTSGETGKPWSPRRVAVVVIAGAMGLGGVGAATIAVRAANSKLATLAARRYAVPRPATDPWLESGAAVTLRTPSGLVARGWQVPSRNGAAVLLVHGTGADRRQLLPEARILHNSGFGVLLLDMPGNGESEGARGTAEDQAVVGAAVDALASAPDVEAQGVGAYGFSGGAAVVAEVAARDPRIRAIALAGCYADSDTHIRHDYRRWGVLSQWPALWAARHAGFVRLRPSRALRALDRPLLLIAGDADDVVAPATARELYATASDPKELWLIPGAGHGGYIEAVGVHHARRLTAFFERGLAIGPAPPAGSP